MAYPSALEVFRSHEYVEIWVLLVDQLSVPCLFVWERMDICYLDVSVPVQKHISRPDIPKRLTPNLSIPLRRNQRQ